MASTALTRSGVPQDPQSFDDKHGVRVDATKLGLRPEHMAHATTELPFPTFKRPAVDGLSQPHNGVRLVGGAGSRVAQIGHRSETDPASYTPVPARVLSPKPEFKHVVVGLLLSWICSPLGMFPSDPIIRKVLKAYFPKDATPAERARFIAYWREVALQVNTVGKVVCTLAQAGLIAGMAATLALTGPGAVVILPLGLATLGAKATGIFSQQFAYLTANEIQGLGNPARGGQGWKAIMGEIKNLESQRAQMTVKQRAAYDSLIAKAEANEAAFAQSMTEAQERYRTDADYRREIDDAARRLAL